MRSVVVWKQSFAVLTH